MGGCWKSSWAQVVFGMSNIKKFYLKSKKIQQTPIIMVSQFFGFFVAFYYFLNAHTQLKFYDLLLRVWHHSSNEVE